MSIVADDFDQICLPLGDRRSVGGSYALEIRRPRRVQ